MGNVMEVCVENSISVRHGQGQDNSCSSEHSDGSADPDVLCNHLKYYQHDSALVL